MSTPERQEATRRLAELIEQRTGIVIPEGQYPHLERVALERSRPTRHRSLASYVDNLEDSDSDPEWEGLLAELTIKESFLFRVPEQFRSLREEILPQLARIRPEGHRLRVWSAGCARGEEPATLSVVLAECPFLANRDWEILATDLDERALAVARRGEFGARAMAQVPAYLLRTWFEQKGEGWALRPELLRHIEFRHFNLFRSPYLSLGPPFDVIFLRNVLIYFHPESQRQVIERVIRHLAPDGTLFLGHSESLLQLSTEMEPLELDQCFVYRKRQRGLEKPPRPSRRKDPAARETVPAPPPARAETPSPTRARREIAAVEWRGAGTRSFVPSPGTRIGAPAEPVPEESVPEPDLSEAARALTEDRLEEAEAIVDRFVAIHKANAEAYALRGLIHDLKGGVDAAIAAYRAALFLEPGYFEIRLLLAHRFEHLGLPARARQEYRQILSDLGNGKARAMSAELGCLRRLLPPREEAERWCRRALERI